MGWKYGPKIIDLRGQMMEFRGETLQKCRSTPKTTDLWIKTTKNATNSEIEFRAIFLGYFSVLGGKNLGDFVDESREKPTVLIPYDAGRYHVRWVKPRGWPDLSWI